MNQKQNSRIRKLCNKNHMKACRVKLCPDNVWKNDSTSKCRMVESFWKKIDTRMIIQR